MKTYLMASVAAIGLTFAAASAQAAAFVDTSPLGTQSNDVFDTPLEGWYGANLYLVGGPATATAHYLGSESGFLNKFTINFNGGGGVQSLDDSGGDADHFPGGGGASISGTLNSGLIQFIFDVVTQGTSIANGANDYVSGTPNFFLTFTSAADPFNPANYDQTADGSTPGGGRSVIIALDDTGAGPDDNHDDLVILLTLENGSFTIPEPTTLALFGAGLAGLGLLARRRKAA